MILSMELAAILSRAEERIGVLGISAREVARRSGKPRVIPNLRRAVKEGNRRGISTATLTALADALEVSHEWLLTGRGDMASERDSAALPLAEIVTLLAWTFQSEGLEETEARIGARAVLRAFRTLEDQQGSPLSPDQRRSLVETAIRLFRPKER